MSVVVVPDYKEALLTHLRAQTGVTTVCASARIKGYLPSAEGMPGYYITAVKMGGIGETGRVHRIGRLDLWLYGKTPYNAMLLWRTVEGILCPIDGIRGFDAAKCRVLDIRAEAEPIEAETPQGWPYVWAPYVLRYAGHPLP